MDQQKNRITRKKDNFSPEFMTGKLPPQALELEEAVLGALMIEKNALEAVADILNADYFYKDAHQYIYSAIIKVSAAGNPVDILTVTNQLRNDGTLEICGGPYYVTQLTNRVASAANIEFHARIIQQKFIQRELIRISGEVQREGFEETADCYNLLDSTILQLDRLANLGVTDEKNFPDQIKASVKQLEETNRKTGITGVSSGLTAIDAKTHGWQNTDFIVLAARPGMGKTTLALQMAKNIAYMNIPVDFYSLEMADSQIIFKLISTESGVELERLKYEELSPMDWEKINKTTYELSIKPFYLNDMAAIKALSLYRSIGRGVRKRGTKIAFVDYLQLVDGGTEEMKRHREQEISYISRTLKKAAKDFKIPVIALAQLSRAVETRGGDKIPMLSDLRESGAIEQDADVVGFLYRPEYYGIMNDEAGNDLKGIAKVIFAKHRNGKTGEAVLKFVNTKSRFEDLTMFDSAFDGFE